MMKRRSLYRDPVILLAFVFLTVTTAAQVKRGQQLTNLTRRHVVLNGKEQLERLEENDGVAEDQSLRSLRQTVDHPTIRRRELLTRTVSKKCRCGSIITQTKFRIVGGTTAKPNSRPWMVALVTKRNFQFCGGVIVNNKYVLTAAHCMNGQNPLRVFAVVGLHDKMNQKQLEVGRRAISKIILHPQYDQQTVENDIALVVLGSPVDFTASVLPICLPEENADYVGCKGTVSGWGATSDKGPTSQVLREVELPILPYSKCVNKFPVGEFTSSMMCAGITQGGQDACQGDSGGPMVLSQNGVWYLAGIVSWGNGCGQANQPGVYTNVSQYISWIYRTTQGAVYCL